MKKNRLFVVALIVALSATPLVPTSSNVSSYDPWLDLNDDGVIDANDLYILASIYSTSGEPINKTELLLELQERIDSLNASLLTDYYNKTDSDLLFVNVPGDTMTGALSVTGVPYGVEGYGSTAGGYFKDTDGTGYAYLGYGDTGVRGYGTTHGGYFKDTDDTGYAYLGYGDFGVEGHGTYGVKGDGTSYGVLGYGNLAGGYFMDGNSTGYAYLGYGDTGVKGSGTSYGIVGYGNLAGGYFKDWDSTGYAYLGYGDTGVKGEGTYGVEGYGTSYGGYFSDTDGTGYAYLGYGDVGVEGYGINYGGFFMDTTDTGYAYLGNSDVGVQGYGDYLGGYFKDTTSNVDVYLARENYALYTQYEIATGDIVFQKDGEELWRMFEDEDGLYVESLKTGKIYSFVLQEVESGKLVESNNSYLKPSGLHINATIGLAGLVIALGLVFGLVRYRAKNSKEEIDAQQTMLSQWQ